MKKAPSENRGAFFWTRPLGVKVQMVQKVQRVQRVKEGGFAANIMGRQSRPALKLASPCLQGEGDHVHYPLASPMDGGGGPRKRWKGLASGDNASYSFLHHSGGSPFGGWRHHLSPYSGGTMGAGHFSQFARGVAAKEKLYNRASPVGNAPLLVPAAPLPPEGEVCSPLGLCSHKNRDGKHRANLHLKVKRLTMI